MAAAKVVVLLCLLAAVLPVTLCGTFTVQNRDTTLDELKDIDSYVSSASDLPLLEKGFFIGTSRGPVLVKSEPPPGEKSRPKVRASYYNTLPRLIPAGFEGLAVSHFNLGAANPYKPLTSARGLFPVPATANIQPQQYTISQSPEQYVQQPLDQAQQVYQRQSYVPQGSIQFQHYVSNSESPQPQVFQNVQSQEVNQQQQQYQQVEQQQGAYLGQQSQQRFIQVDQTQPQFFRQEQSQQQFIPQDQPQQFLGQEQQDSQFPQQDQPQQQFQQQEQPQVAQQEQTQNQFLHQEQPQQQHFQQEESPQQFRFHRQFRSELIQPIPEQQFDSQPAAQASTRISERSQSPEPSFQIDNLLRPEQDQGDVQTYQTQTFGRERFQSQQLLRNDAVLAASQQEETLPDGLRNHFYKNANLATILAQESLPVQGEQIINEWDTNKIAKGKIYALLSGAGLI